ncbi:MAG: response regulator [Xanthomonadales bacterium]|nr:response regulator [Xanthomonadales bacterium]
MRILVVEDEPETADAVRQFLEYRGHDVEIAPSGLEAEHKADHLRPDVLVCDFKIEGSANGVDVAKSVRGRFDIPVIMVTGHRLSQAREKAREIEVNISAFRRKPISLPELASLIELLGHANADE